MKNPEVRSQKSECTAGGGCATTERREITKELRTPYAPGIGLEGPIESATLADGVTFRLLRPFTAISRGHTITAPKGMVTDFASIPRFFWRLLPPLGRYDAAAVIHDHLYQSGRCCHRIGGFEVAITRGEADLILLDLMERLGVERWQRWAIYWGLWLGGWVAWNGYRSGRWKVPR